MPNITSSQKLDYKLEKTQAFLFKHFLDAVQEPGASPVTTIPFQLPRPFKKVAGAVGFSLLVFFKKWCQI